MIEVKNERAVVMTFGMRLRSLALMLPTLNYYVKKRFETLRYKLNCGEQQPARFGRLGGGQK